MSKDIATTPFKKYNFFVFGGQVAVVKSPINWMFSCFLCGKTIESPNNSKIINQVIEGKTRYFHNEDCVIIFKKLESVYGKDHFVIE